MADDFQFGTNGFNTLEARLRAIPRIAVVAAGIETETLAEEILTLSQREFVPIESGALAMSGDRDYYEPARMQQYGDTVIAIWYGSAGGVTNLSRARDIEVAVGTGVNRMSRASHPRNYIGLVMKQGGRGTGSLSGGGAERTLARNALSQEGVTTKDPSRYAVRQHEDLAYRHKPGPGGERPGTAKYLETPFNMLAPSLAPRCAAAVKRAMELTAETVFGEIPTFTSINNVTGLGDMPETYTPSTPPFPWSPHVPTFRNTGGKY